MFDKCYPIVESTLEEKETSPVKLFVKTDEICPLCGGHTVDLMQIDCSDERLSFLGTDENITVKCCPSCVIYSSGDFARYTSGGKGEIFISTGEANGYGSDDYEEEHEDFVTSLNENTYVLGLESVSPRYSADWGKGSTIGGYAFWVNDCKIHTCPDCGKPMKYLAQIDWDSQIDGMGYLYIEVCTDCKVTSVQYQQS